MEIFIVRVEDGDFEGIYFDDELFEQGTLDLYSTFRQIAKLQPRITYFSIEYISQDTFVNHFNEELPQNISKLDGHYKS